MATSTFSTEKKSTPRLRWIVYFLEAMCVFPCDLCTSSRRIDIAKLCYFFRAVNYLVLRGSLYRFCCHKRLVCGTARQTNGTTICVWLCLCMRKWQVTRGVQFFVRRSDCVKLNAVVVVVVVAIIYQASSSPWPRDGNEFSSRGIAYLNVYESISSSWEGWRDWWGHKRASERELWMWSRLRSDLCTMFNNCVSCPSP